MVEDVLKQRCCLRGRKPPSTAFSAMAALQKEADPDALEVLLIG